MLACVRGKEKIVNLLIDHGADVQAVDAVKTLHISQHTI